MCARFSHRLSWQEIHALYQLTSAPSNLEPRYNVCPTDTISAVVERDGRRELVPMRWGLVPYWWKDKANKTPATFNARAETVQEKPFFRAAFRRTRCLIPISGYFEWKTMPDGKQPYCFSRVDRPRCEVFFERCEIHIGLVEDLRASSCAKPASLVASSNAASRSDRFMMRLSE